MSRGAILSALLFSLLLGACGGDSPEEARRKAEEQDVSRVIRKAATSVDPSVCTTLRTRAYVEQIEGVKGAEAVRSCRRTLSRDAADGAEIAFVNVRGDSAETRFALRGGSYDGQTLTVRLLRGKRSWRLDELTDFDLDNRPRFDLALRAELRSPPAALSQRDANCIVGRLKRVKDSAIERSIVNGRSRFLSVPLVTCVIPTAFREAGLSPSQTRCAINRLRRRYSDTELGGFLLAESDSATDRLARAVSPCLT